MGRSLILSILLSCIVLLLLHPVRSTSPSSPLPPPLVRHSHPHTHLQDDAGEKIQTHLMILFLSHGGDDRRMSLRETWLQDEINQTRWMFVLGNIDDHPDRDAVLKEQDIYGDITILNDVIDDYNHLSDKTLKGFKAVYERYDFDFLLKTDTDTFVVLPRLVQYLEAIPPVSRYIGNFAHTTEKSELWYGHLKGVYYMLGGGYLLTYDLVEYFAHSQHLMLRSFSEDVTVGIHLHSLSITMESLDETLFKAGAASACSCESTLMLNHKCKKSEMYLMYHSLQQYGEPCEYKNNTALAQEISRKYDLHTETEEDLIIRWE